MSVDWESVRSEVVDYLQALLRIDTVSPPGNESEAAAYLTSVVSDADIPHELRDHLRYRRHMNESVSLADQRRLFQDRWDQVCAVMQVV